MITYLRKTGKTGTANYISDRNPGRHQKMLFRYGSFDGNRTERTIRYYPAGY